MDKPGALWFHAGQPLKTESRPLMSLPLPLPLSLPSPARCAPILLCSLVLLLGACGGNRNPMMVKRTDCPAVAVVKNANTLTRFRGEGRDAADLLWSANLEGVLNRCNEGKDGKGPIVNSIDVQIGAQRAAAGPAESITVPVFAAVVRDGTTLIAKDVRQVTLNFADKSLQGRASQTFAVTLTDRERAKGGKYEVLFGFQLTSNDVLYNIAR